MKPTNKVVNQIYSTTDYTIFSTVLGNRKLNNSNLKKLRIAITKTDDIRPIEVNEKYQVIDGQHRLKIAEEKGLAIPYYIRKGANLDTVQVLNSNARIWNKDDFMESFIEKGIKDYQIYKEFKDTYKFPHEVCMTLLSGYDGGPSLHYFQQGKFQIKNLKKAVDVANALCRIGDYYKGFTRRAFVSAVLRCLKKKDFDIDSFVKKLSFQGGKLIDCARTDQYLNLIEDIYNYKRTDKLNLKYA